MAAPAPYYYLLPGQACIIPCQGRVQGEDEQTITLSATFYRNQSTLTSYSLPEEHHLLIDDLENVIGLILSASSQDSHTTYHCVVGGLMSMVSQVYVASKPHPSNTT